ncbi:pyridoxamine 5'-phosphate oxidase family protein [Nocardioides sp. L-11A]|uniref:pyridoxamine 5'-phosphate oxidase family protein n=1 Tax=Nocardioides sp. L-11A TaxID=3043848 RepID=UPI00249AF552|nr:pyridoxamine 5'-phosphate oxidase family protein [Nocardioides sp. L-11A]
MPPNATGSGHKDPRISGLPHLGPRPATGQHGGVPEERPDEEVVPVQEYDAQPGRLVVLSEEECWELLRSRPVGRLAWSGADGVSVIPVNFAVADGAVLLRTTPYSLMARDCADREVAFEVDDIDEQRHGGWSVLVRGRCERERVASDGPRPWVTGPRVLGLRIAVGSVTGRRLLSSTAERA